MAAHVLHSTSVVRHSSIAKLAIKRWIASDELVVLRIGLGDMVGGAAALDHGSVSVFFGTSNTGKSAIASWAFVGDHDSFGRVRRTMAVVFVYPNTGRGPCETTLFPTRAKHATHALALIRAVGNSVLIVGVGMISVVLDISRSMQEPSHVLTDEHAD